jgi:hypothetical protein
MFYSVYGNSIFLRKFGTHLPVKMLSHFRLSEYEVINFKIFLLPIPLTSKLVVLHLLLTNVTSHVRSKFSGPDHHKVTYYDNLDQEACMLVDGSWLWLMGVWWWSGQRLLRWECTYDSRNTVRRNVTTELCLYAAVVSTYLLSVDI